MKRAMNARRDEAGFTLAEMLVVVVIVGFIAAVAVPNVGAFFKAYKIRSASDQLVGHLRAARQIAVTQRLPVTFTINPSPANTYSFNYTIPGKPTTTQTFSIAGGVNVTNAPAGALAFTITQTGTVSNPTLPDESNPTTNYTSLSTNLGSGVIDLYKITLTAAGKVGVRFTR